MTELLLDRLAALAEPIWLAWQDGDATDIEAILQLYVLLGQLEGEILKPAENFREILRIRIGQAVAHYGTPLELRGLGRFEITGPAIVKGYDRAKLNDLITELARDGRYAAIIEAIEACQTETQRAGSLRITREKPGKELER